MSRWYHLPIREMVMRRDFREDPAWIAEQLLFPIKPEQVEEALALLLEMGLLARDESGELIYGGAGLSGGPEAASVSVRAFHRQMLDRAAASLDVVADARRDVSAVTVCLRSDSVPEFKQRLDEFRGELLDMCDAQQEPDAIYQLNMQLFPWSREEDT